MSARTIQSGDRVTLHYRLACLDQEIANTFQDAPETLRIGTGELDAGLERALSGLTEGEHRTLRLTPWDAFGERDESLVQPLPRRDFPAELELNLQVEFDLPNGHRWLGTVIALDDDTVTVDFNHPLAGLPVEFEVQILAINHDQ